MEELAVDLDLELCTVIKVEEVMISDILATEGKPAVLVNESDVCSGETAVGATAIRDCIRKVIDEEPPTVENPVDEVDDKTKATVATAADGKVAASSSSNSSWEQNFITYLNAKQSHRVERKFVCELCNKAFKSEYHLLMHQNSHTEERPHQCSLCGEAFRSRIKLGQHQLLVHEQDSKLKSKVPSELEKDMRDHGGRPFQCDICGASYKSAGGLNSHRKRHSFVEPKPFKCGICGKSFATTSNLNVHTAIHMGKKEKETNFKCEICGKGFIVNASLTKHKKLHMDPPHKCRTCGAGFLYPYKLVRHMRSHSDERLYNCDICGVSFKTPDGMSTHRITHFYLKPKPFECTECGQHLPSKDSLRQHARKHNIDFQCSKCNQGFTSVQALKRHEAKRFCARQTKKISQKS